MLTLEPTKPDADALALRRLLDDYLAGQIHAAFIAVQDAHGVVTYISIGQMPEIAPYESDRLHSMHKGD